MLLWEQSSCSVLWALVDHSACIALCLAQADELHLADDICMAVALSLASMIEVVTIGFDDQDMLVQVYCWTRQTRGLSSLELWRLCMHWALQALLCWGLASFSITMIDNCLRKGSSTAAVQEVQSSADDQ